MDHFEDLDLDLVLLFLFADLVFFELAVVSYYTFFVVVVPCDFVDLQVAV